MFEKTLLSPPPLPNSEYTKNQALLISSYRKGGDFMGLEQNDPTRQQAIEDAVRRMEWEGALLPGIVEVGSNPTTHPLRKGRIRIPTASEIAVNTDPLLRQPQ